MMRFLLYSLRIRRIEYRIAELPIFGIPVILTLPNTTSLRSGTFWEGLALFLLLFAFGDMANCLADRELDSTGKPHLTEAVYGLGTRGVVLQIMISAVVSLFLALHLAWSLGRWLLLPMILIGLLLGAAYSVPPLRLKGRGLAHMACLWIILFFGPMLFASLLFSPVVPLALPAFAAAYATVQMGVILINSAEDYREDMAAGVRTTIVALGLRRGIGLAFGLALAGTLALFVLLLCLAWKHTPLLPGSLILLSFLAVAGTICFQIGSLYRRIATAGIDEGMRAVKQAAKVVPLWITGVAWSAQLTTLALYFLAAAQHPLLS